MFYTQFAFLQAAKFPNISALLLILSIHPTTEPLNYTVDPASLLNTQLAFSRIQDSSIVYAMKVTKQQAECFVVQIFLLPIFNNS